MPALSAPVCGLTLVAWGLAELSSAELWWLYLGLGGNRALDALADYLAGTAEWTHFEHNVLAQALNERLWDRGFPSLVPHRHLGTGRAEPA